MSYGSKTNEKGQDIKADDRMPVITGYKVPGNKIVRFGLAEDFQTGEILDNQAEIVFEQANGARVFNRFFGGDQAWQIDMINRQFLHICSKIVTEAEYWATIEGVTGFSDLVKRIEEKIMPKAADVSFNLRIVYNTNKTSGKSYVGLPKFGNFIEPEGTEPTTLAERTGDLYEAPKVTNIEDVPKAPVADATPGTEATTF